MRTRQLRKLVKSKHYAVSHRAYVDELCEYNFKQGMTLTNTNDDN